MSRNTIVFAIALVTTFAVSLTASAQERRDIRVAEDGRGLTYEFLDDPLAAGGWTPNDAHITVPRRTVRATLIRPRTNFVSELLKSVENI